MIEFGGAFVRIGRIKHALDRRAIGSGLNRTVEQRGRVQGCHEGRKVPARDVQAG
jgi:hypothetical protein